MSKPKRVRRCRKKVAKDDANGNTGAVPDENTVDDEVPNKDDLAAAISTRLARNRVSSGDVEEKIDDGEREVEDAKSGDDEDEANTGEELVPRRGRIMSPANMLIKAKNDHEGKKQPPAALFDSAANAPTPEQSAVAREAKRAKQIARQVDTVEQNSLLQPLAGGMVQLMPGKLAPDAAADKALVTASAAAKATVALNALASAQAVGTHMKGLGAAPDLLPQTPPIVGATGSPQSPPQTEPRIVETRTTVLETPTHTDEVEFPENRHEMVLLVVFISYSLNDVHESPPGKAKRYLDWIVQRLDPDHNLEHVYSQENLALVTRLTDYIPRPRMRQHHQDFFNSGPQTETILMELLNLVRMHVAMQGHGSYADNEPGGKWDK